MASEPETPVPPIYPLLEPISLAKKDVRVFANRSDSKPKTRPFYKEFGEKTSIFWRSITSVGNKALDSKDIIKETLSKRTTEIGKFLKEALKDNPPTEIKQNPTASLPVDTPESPKCKISALGNSNVSNFPLEGKCTEAVPNPLSTEIHNKDFTECPKKTENISGDLIKTCLSKNLAETSEKQSSTEAETKECAPELNSEESVAEAKILLSEARIVLSEAQAALCKAQSILAEVQSVVSEIRIRNWLSDKYDEDCFPDFSEVQTEDPFSKSPSKDCFREEPTEEFFSEIYDKAGLPEGQGEETSSEIYAKDLPEDQTEKTSAAVSNKECPLGKQNGETESETYTKMCLQEEQIQEISLEMYTKTGLPAEQTEKTYPEIYPKVFSQEEEQTEGTTSEIGIKEYLPGEQIEETVTEIYSKESAPEKQIEETTSEISTKKCLPIGQTEETSSEICIEAGPQGEKIEKTITEICSEECLPDEQTEEATSEIYTKKPLPEQIEETTSEIYTKECLPEQTEVSSLEICSKECLPEEQTEEIASEICTTEGLPEQTEVSFSEICSKRRLLKEQTRETSSDISTKWCLREEKTEATSVQIYTEECRPEEQTEATSTEIYTEEHVPEERTETTTIEILYTDGCPSHEQIEGRTSENKAEGSVPETANEGTLSETQREISLSEVETKFNSEAETAERVSESKIEECISESQTVQCVSTAQAEECSSEAQVEVRTSEIKPKDSLEVETECSLADGTSLSEVPAAFSEERLKESLSEGRHMGELKLPWVPFAAAVERASETDSKEGLARIQTECPSKGRNEECHLGAVPKKRPFQVPADERTSESRLSGHGKFPPMLNLVQRSCGATTGGKGLTEQLHCGVDSMAIHPNENQRAPVFDKNHIRNCIEQLNKTFHHYASEFVKSLGEEISGGASLKLAIEIPPPEGLVQGNDPKLNSKNLPDSELTTQQKLEETSPGTHVYYGGDKLCELVPFVCVLFPNRITTHCSYCFTRLEVEKLRCKQCSYAYYCDKNCQTEHSNLHRRECKSLRQKIKPDAHARMVAHFMWKLEEPESKFFCNTVGDKDYYYKDLKSCEDVVMNTPSFREYFVKEYHDFVNYFRDFLVPFEKFCHIYAQYFKYSEIIEDPYGDPLGTGIYFGIGAFEHSCIPTANVVMFGIMAQIICCSETGITEPQMATLRRVDCMVPREERHTLLTIINGGSCDCDRCKDESFEDLITEQADGEECCCIMSGVQLIVEDITSRTSNPYDDKKMLKMSRDAYALMKNVAGEMHHLRGKVLEIAADSCRHLEYFQPAIEYYEELEPIHKFILGPYDRKTMNTFLKLSELHLKVGHRREARERHIEAMHCAYNIFGHEHPIFRAIRYRFIELENRNWSNTLSSINQ